MALLVLDCLRLTRNVLSLGGTIDVTFADNARVQGDTRAYRINVVIICTLSLNRCQQNNRTYD
jgi:hypothetical protein